MSEDQRLSPRTGLSSCAAGALIAPSAEIYVFPKPFRNRGHFSAEELAARIAESVGRPAVRKPRTSRTSLALPRLALKAIWQVAIEEDRTADELLLEGVELLLARLGLPSLAEFEEADRIGTDHRT